MGAENRVVRVVPTGTDRDTRGGGSAAVSAGDPRDPARHDRDRIYYSAAFRRLAGVTQVLTPTYEGHLTHNRLTHSLKVAQVAESIANVLISQSDLHGMLVELGGLDVDVVAAAGLAHDLGHPPFGHIGETVLDKYAREILHLVEGFEGNAQTFRICTRLEPRQRKDTGMDLTAATRAAVLKYPWFRELDAEQLPASTDGGRKFGAYRTEADAFDSARLTVPLGQTTQSLEAAVMDIADDITYALHDLEDFAGSALLDLLRAEEELNSWRSAFARAAVTESTTFTENPFENLRRTLSRKHPSRFDASEFADAADYVLTHLTQLRQYRTGARRASANTRSIVSKLITAYVEAVELRSASDPVAPVGLQPQEWHQVQILKEVTRHFVIRLPEFATIQRGQMQLLWELLDLLQAWRVEDPDRLPSLLREGLDEYDDRALIDYVAGLGDHQALALHRTLTGRGSQTLLGGFPG